MHIRDWVVHARPGRAFLEILAPSPDLSWFEHAEIVEKGLDMLSVSGGQHYEREESTSANQRIRWDWKDGQFQVEVRSLWNEEAPYTIFVGPAGQVKAEEANRRPKYSKAMRYFRASQTAGTFAATYQNMFLCFEALLSQKVPKKDEREFPWLLRAAAELVPTYEERARDEIAAAGGLESDLRSIYALRLAAFHAKLDRDPLLPGDESRLVEAKKVYWRLVDHVRELFRAYEVWPPGTRMETVASVNEKGEFLATLTQASLLYEGSPPPAEFVDSQQLGTVRAEFVVEWRLPEGLSDYLRGFSWTFEGMKPTHWLTFMPVTKEPTLLKVRLTAGGGFRHLIRCPEA